jgi:hypothetical protein
MCWCGGGAVRRNREAGVLEDEGGVWGEGESVW